MEGRGESYRGKTGLGQNTEDLLDLAKESGQLSAKNQKKKNSCKGRCGLVCIENRTKGVFLGEAREGSRTQTQGQTDTGVINER